MRRKKYVYIYKSLMFDSQQVTSVQTSSEDEIVIDHEFTHTRVEDNQSNQDVISQAIGNHYTSGTPFGGDGRSL